MDFLQSVVPLRFRHDKQLVSHNEHTSSYRYKYTFSAEIVPICKVGGTPRTQPAAGLRVCGCYQQRLTYMGTATTAGPPRVCECAQGSASLQEDLICLPAKLSSSNGGIGPLVLCTRVTNSIALTDPATLRQIHLDVRHASRACAVPPQCAAGGCLCMARPGRITPPLA